MNYEILEKEILDAIKGEWLGWQTWKTQYLPSAELLKASTSGDEIGDKWRNLQQFYSAIIDHLICRKIIRREKGKHDHTLFIVGRWQHD